MLVKNVIFWDQTKRKDEFSNMDRLHQHKKRHNQFQCDQCIFKSSTKEEVSDYVKRMHVIKRKCNLCEFSTDSKASLYEHGKGFHNIKSYNCAKCDKTFTDYKDIKHHEENPHTNHNSNPQRTHSRRIVSQDERERMVFVGSGIMQLVILMMRIASSFTKRRHTVNFRNTVEQSPVVNFSIKSSPSRSLF